MSDSTSARGFRSTWHNAAKEQCSAPDRNQSCSQVREVAERCIEAAQAASHAGRIDDLENECEKGALALAGHGDDCCRDVRLRLSITQAWSVLERSGLEASLLGLDNIVIQARSAGLPAVAIRADAQAAMVLGKCHEPQLAWDRFQRIESDLGHLSAIDRLKLRINRSGTGALAHQYAKALDEICLAESDLAEVGDIVLETMVRHNAAYLEHLLGQHISALRGITKLKGVRGEIDSLVIDTTRAQILVQLGFVVEAKNELSAILDSTSGKVEPIRLAEPHLELAWVCRILGEFELSVEYVARAQQMLRQVNAAGWLLRAELTRLVTDFQWLQSRVDGLECASEREQLVNADGVAMERAARDLEVRAEKVGAEDIRARAALIQAELSVMRDHPMFVGHHLTRCSTLAESGLLTSRLAYLRVKAWLADRVGDESLRDHLLQHAARDYAEQALTTASLDIRLAAATHVDELSKLDAAIGLYAGDANEALARVERWRVAWLGGGSLSPADKASADKLAALRAARLRLKETADPLEAESVRTQIRELEESVREDGWLQSVSPSAPVSPASPMEVHKVLREERASLCSFTCSGSHVYAILLTPEGSGQIVTLGTVESLTSVIERVRTDWHAYLVITASGDPPRAMIDTVQKSLQASLVMLDDHLLRPLGPIDSSLVVIPCLSLANVPWAALPSRRGLPTTLSRSASAWTYAAQQAPRRCSKDPLRVRGAWGPELQHANGEVHRIADAWGLPTEQVAFACTSEGVKRILSEADVVSLAVHGQHDPSNPLFSTLHLEDGVTSAHDFLPEDVRASLVFVSACEGGRVTRRVGDEMWGLVAALLGAGVRTVVAPTAKVPDNQAMQCMARTHQLLAQGVDVATAVAQATAAVDLSAGSFVVYGGPWSTKAILENRANVGAVRSSCGLAVTA